MMKNWKKILTIVMSMILCFNMTLMPVDAVQAGTDVETTKANVKKVENYARQLSGATRVDTSNGGMSWDTEKKTYSWAYFNGVMLDAFMMIDSAAYYNYVNGFYSANINSSGMIVNMTGTKPSVKEGALDNIEPIRAAFDVLGGPNDKRIKDAIQEMYRQLEAMTTYPNCGGNYVHKQNTDGTPTSSWSAYPIALDGIYMAQPFLMECANAIDAGKITLTDKNKRKVTSDSIYNDVYNRVIWISENLYNPQTGLYDHAYNPNTRSTNGIAWSRSIGWYAMALVDIIEMMPAGSKKENLKKVLPDLFDGMLRYQDEETGLWYNVTAYDSSLTSNNGNMLETSGSSMMAYALCKAYKNGWVSDRKYGEAGVKAFNGIVDNKMIGSGPYSVIHTYRNSGASPYVNDYTKADYTTNEAKGVGPLIMAATVVQPVANMLAIPEELYDEATGITVAGSKATGMEVGDVSATTTISDLADDLKAYDIHLENYTEGTDKTITIPIPEGMDEDTVKVYYVGTYSEPVEIAVTKEDGKVKFDTTEIGVFVIGHAPVDHGDGGSGDSGNQPGSGGNGDSGNQPGSGGNGDSGNQPGSGGDGDNGNQPGSGGDGDNGNQPGSGGDGDNGNQPGSGGDGDNGNQPDIEEGQPIVITIHDSNGKAADAFEVYQIFKCKILSNGTIGDHVLWGDGIHTVNGKIQVGDKHYTAQELIRAYNKNEISVNDFIDAVSSNLSETNYTGIANEDDDAVIQLPGAGYYFIRNTEGSAKDGEAYTRFITSIMKEETILVNTKTDAPYVEKKLKDYGESDEWYRDANNGKIGDVVNYRITSSVPDLSNYNAYTFILHDTMSAGLSYQEGSLKVMLGGKELEADKDYTVDIHINNDKETVFDIDFKNFIQYKGSAGAGISVTYDAVINEDAIIGEDGNPNYVYLTYSNDPNHTGDGHVGKTPKSWTKTFVAKLLAFKYDGADGTPLKGATITLSGTQSGCYFIEDDTLYVSTIEKEVISDEDGYVDFGTLGTGNYTITEIKAPDGYNLLKEPIEIVIESDSNELIVGDDTVKTTWKVTANGELITNEIKNNVIEKTDDPNVFLIGIENRAGSILPSTGGIGTKLASMIGMAMMVGAAILLVTKRRMTSEWE